ncbi:MarR family transcriptional regulator [Rhodococcus sp. Leaf7]|uniref:MarR family winged helix-turn-helix transcriptional regulator n=1 Tax=unclassified Rhodococcus (in: high G+C Gram-positive bacteria) TaxID=192944 RepID=UPI0005ABD4AA|nr:MULTISPECIES: MarR family transcriptional regulator [unclassified Rhodococcus (in: high G+C Gram-positive bacteria)]KIQ15067.1 MarR family transcriptional regulator [Rhodococcus sp. MEB064]KQU03735.1 MarR family transcriptional regulator [Rhodococcus sp. Leaf7]KQU39921.1 MarR family transcriptional regulator [Rhodococcus sp. Leaf247]
MSSAPKLPLDPIAEAHRQWLRHGWADAADGMAAVTSIMRVQQIMMARVEEVLKPTGLTFARYELLTLLTFTKTGALPMAKASARLQVHPTSVTNAVDRLEKAGLVRRVPHPTDRRTTLVEITDTGRTLAVAATEDLNDRVFGLPGADGADLDKLVSILAGIRRRAGDFDDEGASGW